MATPNKMTPIKVIEGLINPEPISFNRYSIAVFSNFDTEAQISAINAQAYKVGYMNFYKDGTDLNPNTIEDIIFTDNTKHKVITLHYHISMFKDILQVLQLGENFTLGINIFNEGSVCADSKPLVTNQE